jgi:hypothetical protein
MVLFLTIFHVLNESLFLVNGLAFQIFPLNSHSLLLLHPSVQLGWSNKSECDCRRKAMSVWPLNFIKIFSVPPCRTIVTIKLSFLKKSFGSHQFWNQIDSGARAPVPYFGFRKCRV